MKQLTYDVVVDGNEVVWTQEYHTMHEITIFEGVRATVEGGSIADLHLTEPTVIDISAES